MKTAIIYDKWLTGLGGGEVVACNMATILRDSGYDVLFACQKKVSPDVIKEKLGINMSGITFVKVSNEQDLKDLITKKPTTNNQQLTTIDLFINLSFMDYSYGIGKKNIYYVHFPTPFRSFAFNLILLFLKITNLPFDSFNSTYNKFAQGKQSLFNRLKERIEDRLRAGIYFDMKKRLDSYDLFITHSEYVSKWTKTYWNKNAKVLYPPVKLLCHCEDSDVMSEDEAISTGSPRPFGARDDKRNWIVSVGRFFTLGHGKKQEIMIEAFKMVYDSLNPNNKIQNPSQILNPKSKIKIVNLQSPIANRHSPISNLQLHLIGGVGTEPSSVRFVEQLKELAKGYPIFFHFNATRSEVEEILLKSKIYWHAAGYGENPKKNPIKFEHFGIAPVEAISAGCIPILFDGGGLREIVSIFNLNPNLHLFSSIEELCSKTTLALKSKSSDKTTSANRLSAFAFKKEFSAIINNIWK